MVDGTSVMYSFGSSEAYSLDFSESIRFQYGLNYHLLGKRQQVIIQLICHAMDQLATKGENSKSDWINVKWVDSQKDWELKHVSNPEKGFELNTFMYTNARLYLFYYGVPVFGLAGSSELDCFITYLDPRYPVDDWIDEVLELALWHAEFFGAHSLFK